MSKKCLGGPCTTISQIKLVNTLLVIIDNSQNDSLTSIINLLPFILMARVCKLKCLHFVGFVCDSLPEGRVKMSKYKQKYTNGKFYFNFNLHEKIEQLLSSIPCTFVYTSY